MLSYIAFIYKGELSRQYVLEGEVKTKNNSKPVSRVLSLRPKAKRLIIYLGLHSRAGSINLPTVIGRAALSLTEARH